MGGVGVQRVYHVKAELDVQCCVASFLSFFGSVQAVISYFFTLGLPRQALLCGTTWTVLRY